MKKKTKILEKSRTESVREGSALASENGTFKQRKLVNTRTYRLLLVPNRDKFDTARYLINRFNSYVNICLGKLYFNGNKTYSTSGLGQLFNQAQHKARSMIKAQTAAQKETKDKTNVPIVSDLGVPVKYEISKSKKFNYWVKVSNQFTQRGIVKIPAKSTKALNEALKDNWKLTNFGEIKLIKGKLFLIVFVQREADKPFPEKEVLGIDVGIKNSVTTSENHQGPDLRPIIKKFKNSKAERDRQRMKFNQKQKPSKSNKTFLKQTLNKEVKLAVARCSESKLSLAVESRKILNNLKSGKLSLWARNYFANRCEILCKEKSVFFVEINPWRTSQMCHACGLKGHRSGKIFKCTNCGEFDADFNAAKNISDRGRQVISEKLIPIFQKYNKVVVGSEA